MNESQTHVLHVTSASNASYLMKSDVLMLLAQFGLNWNKNLKKQIRLHCIER
jgi:hypothetical protein